MNNVISLILVTVFISTCAEEQPLKLPSYIEVCYRDDPEVAGCIKRNIEKFLSKFKSGSKDFDLASMDPMQFKNLNFNYKSFIAGGDLSIPRFDVHGLSKLRVVDVRPKTKIPGVFELDFDGEISTLNLKTDYNITGNFFTIPSRFHGFLDIVFNRLLMTYHLAGKVRTKGDNDYLDLTEFKWRFRDEGVGEAYLKNDDVVNNRPALSRALKNALHNNWRILKTQMLPVVFPVSDDLLRDFFHDLFAKYPYDVLFPRRTRL